jgi:hypothetical protein
MSSHEHIGKLIHAYPKMPQGNVVLGVLIIVAPWRTLDSLDLDFCSEFHSISWPNTIKHTCPGSLWTSSNLESWPWFGDACSKQDFRKSQGAGW